MSRPVKAITILSLVAVAALWAAPASAQCTFPQLFGHVQRTWLACDDSGPVFADATAIRSDGTTVSTDGSKTIICRSSQDASIVQGAICGAESGVVGDNQIQISGNWGSPGVTGCANPTGTPGEGRNFYTVNDASGDEIILSVGYDTGVAGYIADLAGPADKSPLACGPASGGITFGGSTTNADGSVTVNITVTGCPRIFSDCDAGSLGQALGGTTCTQADADLLAAIKPLNLYTAEGPCDSMDLSLGTGMWTSAGEVPADGNAVVTVPPPAAGNCAFIGRTCGTKTVILPGFCAAFPGLSCTTDVDCTIFGPDLGPCVIQSQLSEIGVVSGAVRVAGDLAAPPRVQDLLAGLARGHVQIDFRTTTELGLAAIAVVTPSGRVVANVEPRGIGGAGAEYSLSVGRGQFRNEKALMIQLTLASGEKINSNQVRFQ
ncbi:MAG: hypothetical protein ACE5JH_05585 [Acidobacteriota bacterium]